MNNKHIKLKLVENVTGSGRKKEGSKVEREGIKVALL